MNLRGSPLFIAVGLALVLCSCGAASTSPTPASIPDAPDPSRPPTQSPSPTDRIISQPTGQASEILTTATAPPGASVPPIGGGAGQIAFVSNRDGNDEIYIMAVDGANQSRLTSNTRYDIDPAWSPDGQTLVFGSERDGEPAIFAMGPDGGGATRLTPDKIDSYQPAWSPDGRQIAFNCRVDIFPDTCTMAPDGSGLTRIHDGGQVAQLAWSPDSLRLAFLCNGGTDDICVMTRSADDRIQLTSNLARDLEPAWSPDGRWIAFASNRDGRWGIYRMAADGREARRLTFTDVDPGGDFQREGTYGSPAWSPDGQWIAFVSNLDGNSEIYLMKPDGSALTRLTSNDASDWAPSWRP